MSPLPPTRERPVAGPGAGLPEWGGGSEQPRKKRRWLKRLGITLLVLIALALGAVGATAFLAKQQIDNFVTAKTADQKGAQKLLAKPQAGKPTNILLLGSDHRPNVGESGSNSDTLMLVRLNPQNNTISILSFPRDLYVPIPGHGTAKINSAFAAGGETLTTQTIKQLTGLDVNFVMDVDFKGFIDIVDQLKGIYIDVDHTYYVPPNAGYNAIDIKPGYQRLRGRDALDFARHRHSDDDFHRIARQQMVLTSLKKQLQASPLRNNIRGLIRVMTNNTHVVAGGGNSVSYGVLKDFVTLGLGLNGKDIYQIEYAGTSSKTAAGESVVDYDKAKLDSAVAAFLNPNSTAREQTADALVGKGSATGAAATTGTAQPASTTPAAPLPSTVSVKVLNGSGIGGSAATMATALRGAGYNVAGSQTNADNQNYSNTRIQYRNPANKVAAEALAQTISGASAEASDGSNTFDTKLLVIVGKTGTTVDAGVAGSTTGAAAGSTSTTAGQYAGNIVPAATAAAVSPPDREYGKGFFLDLATSGRKLGFPILYPTVRATGSTFVDVTPYSVAKGATHYQAYRLVAKMPSNGLDAYYGLQGTSWPNPPILDSPTRSVTRGGRQYDLFFNGTHLHMIAWHQGNGTYWIANSLLDNLSNPTMLAIAQGVKPY